jgi:hypothetical protein
MCIVEEEQGHFARKSEQSREDGGGQSGVRRIRDTENNRGRAGDGGLNRS